MNKKAFTLIELLAVIIILGLLMAIAIPSVTRYIEQSRKKVYINSLNSYVDSLTKAISSGDIPNFYEEDTVYHIPFNCIKIENNNQTLSDKWEFAYVLVTNTNGQRKYSLYTKDINNRAVIGVDVDSLKMTDITSTYNTAEDYLEIDGKNKMKIVPDTCDYNNLLVRVAPFQPDDKCFTMYTTGIISKWNTTTMDENDPCYTTNLIIPSKVNNQTATEIADTVFNGKKLDKVTMPNTIKSIGYGAFLGNNLTSINLHEGITEIRGNAFYGNKLKTVTIPKSLKTISDYTFQRNELLAITLHNELTRIGTSAFYGNKLTSITIPDSVTSIGSFAFMYNELADVKLSNSLLTIDANAFSYNKLTKIDFPSSLTTIMQKAFTYNFISEVIIPVNVTRIDSYAFDNIGLLKKIILQGRSSTTGMTLGYNWNGLGTIVFQP